MLALTKLYFCLFGLQMIVSDVTAHKEEIEMLSAAAASSEEPPISDVVSKIVTQYTSLVNRVDGRVSLVEKSVEVHQTYCDRYRHCQELIVTKKQCLQQIHDALLDGVDSTQQQIDLLKVDYCIL